MWKLLAYDATAEEYCEIVFRMEGVLVTADLVVANNIGRRVSRQAIVLSLTTVYQIASRKGRQLEPAC